MTVNGIFFDLYGTLLVYGNIARGPWCHGNADLIANAETSNQVNWV